MFSQETKHGQPTPNFPGKPPHPEHPDHPVKPPHPEHPDCPVKPETPITILVNGQDKLLPIGTKRI